MNKNIVKRKDVIVKPKTLELKLSVLDVALKLGRRSKEEVRNKPVFEEIEYTDKKRTSIISKERTEQATNVYHSGKIFKDGKWDVHPKHLKSPKKYKK